MYYEYSRAEWDAMPQIQREQLCSRIGWITRDGRLTRSGRLIARQSWAELSKRMDGECIQELIARFLAHAEIADFFAGR